MGCHHDKTRSFWPLRKSRGVLLALITVALQLLMSEHAMAQVDADDMLRVLSFRDYNTRVVVGGVTLLGLAAGTIGVFALLRKRSLMADAVAHATLPGIAAAFLVAAAFGHTGRSLPVLLGGATLAGLVGMGTVLAIRHTTRIKDDAALGIVLSVFFGLGVALLGIVQQLPGGNAAGIDRFILGQAAALSATDAWTMLVAAAVIAFACLVLYKEFALICFDAQYASAQGWAVLAIDVLMMAMVVAVTVIGLQAVGLVLVVGLLIIPPAAARFWTDRLFPMVVTAALIGAGSGFLGALVSAMFPRMPTGPVIVLVCAMFFIVSLLAGPRRGVVAQLVRHISVRRRTEIQHLLRDLYEHPTPPTTTPPAPPLLPTTDRAAGEGTGGPVPVEHLLRRRSWSRFVLKRLLGRAEREGLVTVRGGSVRLTETGRHEAVRVVRNHRLWELFLIRYADIAPSHVDRDADDIEHVLGEGMVRELETLLHANHRMPESPHTLP
ncbi:MAG: iron chelate uptake ABC transporter family permease subunit [Phycisphaeraceae bacterium]